MQGDRGKQQNGKDQRSLQENWRYQGTINTKIGTTKGKKKKKNDLIEAEEIKKSWQEYTEELYRKTFNDSVNHGHVVTHLEPDILECEVKWALGSITTKKKKKKEEEEERNKEKEKLVAVMESQGSYFKQ